MDYITIEQMMIDNKLELISGAQGLNRHCVEEMISRIFRLF